MCPFPRCSSWRFFIVALAIWATGDGRAPASEIVTKTGWTKSGDISYHTDIIGDLTVPDPEGYKAVVVIHDQLRRYIIPQGQVEEVRRDEEELLEKFTLRQAILDAGAPVASVGPIISTTEWDDHGHRILKMATDKGPIDIIQGIVEITPRYVIVQPMKKYKWNMRIATSSIPKERLHAILTNPNKQILDLKNVEHRKRLVRFYLQCERYEDAAAELAKVVEEFPGEKEDLSRTLRSLNQLTARRLLSELRVRETAGQDRMVEYMLANFPSEGVAGETLQQVQDTLDDFKQQRELGQKALGALQADIENVADTALRERLKAIYEEIRGELTIHTLDRMAAYVSFIDKELEVESKVALAISGWVQGSEGAVDQLSVALSLYDVRTLIHDYFNANNLLERKAVLEKIRKQEGGTTANLAKLLAFMKPPVDTAPQSEGGYYILSAAGATGDAGHTYHLQLPPEYDPHRKYPAVISLHGSSTTPAQQVDWWAGAVGEKGRRQGQATRHGYIVIAPAWGEEHQNEYKFSGREHAAVLSTLRDACRRFSIDTDRVFLSGHSMGGAAAWDIAVAHPDLWAGVIPIAARCDKYTDIYWRNARYVPMYVVGGELDGGWLGQNSTSLQRYLKGAYPTVIVEFLGRGHEHFGDEVIEIFDWMNLFRRDFGRKQFTCYTLRPWDNYFWFAELQGIPDRAVVLPEDFATAKRKRPFEIQGEIKGNNNLFFRGGADKVVLWLSPDQIDFGSPSTFIVNGKSFTFPGGRLQGDAETLLEDVRTRGDRQHPFWARVTFPEGVLARVDDEKPPRRAPRR